MLTNGIFLLMMASPSIYLAARLDKRFEQTFPLSVMASVLILFGFGLGGILKLGVPFLLCLSVCMYMLTVGYLLRKRCFRSLIENLVTPGAVFFLIVYALLTVWNHGKMACNWDEFSHWVDIVKAATYIDDFGTNPAANSTFRSYPPAMMLFQYALQKVYMLVKPEFGFSEWRAYFAYQIFFIAVMLPFFRNISFRKPVSMMTMAAIILLAPMVFFGNLYSAVYIDGFVGILFGAGLAMTILRTKRDVWFQTYICLLCAVLTIAKDVGFAFSLILALVYAVDALLDSNAHSAAGRWLMAPLALIAAYLPKLLWGWELKTSAARVSFSGSIDWEVLWNVLLGRDTTYRSQLVPLYFEALCSQTVSFGRIPLKCDYVALILLFWGAFFLIWMLFRKKQPEQSKRCGIILAISAGALVAYTLGLCVIYMFKFSEYEAMRLASMDRYLNIAFVGIWMVIALVTAYWAGKLCSRVAMPMLLILLLLMTPVRTFAEFARGNYVNQSIQVRATYQQLHTEIQKICDGDDRIYFVSQETTGFDYWVSRYNARPNMFNENFSWSIGEPFYDGDIWTKKMTPDQWQSLLMETYDYVALYKINDYFLENFSHLFQDPDAIQVNKLYRINRDTGLLDMCE